MEVYGKTGFIFADREGIRYLTSGSKDQTEEKVPERKAPFNDPFRLLQAVVRGSVKLEAHDLSGLPVNMVAMEILDAAKRSASSGKVVYLGKK